MKKLCISIIMAVLILAVCFVIGCSCSQESPTDLVKAEALASKQHAKLVEFLKESSGANIYDDGLDLNLYYGGSYLDDEKRLTICCTTEDNLIVEAFREAAGSPYVAVKYVKFTKEELDSLKEEFAGLLKAYKVDEELDEKEMLTNSVMGLCGESGEACDLVKKHLFHGHELDRESLIKELGDVAWYLAEGAEALGIPLEEVFERNIEKLRRRYPEGFSSEKSINRNE